MEAITDVESYLFIISRNHIFNMLKKVARETAFKNEISHNTVAVNTTDFSLQDEQYMALLKKVINKLQPQNTSRRYYFLFQIQ
ncbi:hypothetical protein [Flavobacterium sp. FlaQc-47]|uniref:hypothetical protein n=1 Tax=Flavobacterium sp. FlaQc-47 TaxID=3374180 RepID=UPI003757F1A7